MISYRGLDGLPYTTEGTLRPFKDGKPGDLFTYGTDHHSRYQWVKLNDDGRTSNCRGADKHTCLGLVFPNDICRFLV